MRNRSRGVSERWSGGSHIVGFDSGDEVVEDRSLLKAARFADREHSLDEAASGFALGAKG